MLLKFIQYLFVTVVSLDLWIETNYWSTSKVTEIKVPTRFGEIKKFKK